MRSLATIVTLLTTLSPANDANAEALLLPAAFADGNTLNWRVMTDAFGGTVDYPASIFTTKAQPPPRGIGESLASDDGSARFMMYVERNADHLTPEEFIRRNLGGPQSLLEYRRVSDGFFAASVTTANAIFYSRCNFPAGAAGNIHCIFLSYPKSEKRAWDDVVTRMSLSLRAQR
jgi:hypothetical protein